MRVRRIETELRNGVHLIPAYEFFGCLAFAKCNYPRWLRNIIIARGVKNVDYFDAGNTMLNSTKGARLRVLITIDFAIGITYKYNDYLAKTMRAELIRIRNTAIFPLGKN